MSLQEHVETFTQMWGPKKPAHYAIFVEALRNLMNTYAQAALEDGSIPDTEHHVCREDCPAQRRARK